MLVKMVDYNNLSYFFGKNIIDYMCDKVQNSMITKIKRVVLQLADKINIS